MKDDPVNYLFIDCWPYSNFHVLRYKIKAHLYYVIECTCPLTLMVFSVNLTITLIKKKQLFILIVIFDVRFFINTLLLPSEYLLYFTVIQMIILLSNIRNTLVIWWQYNKFLGIVYSITNKYSWTCW